MDQSQVLSSPATEKKTESGEDDRRILFAASAMQGWRNTMEDFYAVVLTEEDGTKERNAFFGVYDGHFGAHIAQFAAKNVHKRLLADEFYRQKRYAEAMTRAFIGTDQDLLAAYKHVVSGSTAIAALLTHDGKIYVANAGDSRSVISINGACKPLSFDHKPTNHTELNRIYDAGGYVRDERVNGNLAMSRALGDFEFKSKSLTPQKQIITSNPSITVHEITIEDEFLVLASDGIWDCLSSQAVVNFVRLRVSEGKELSEISEGICQHCLAPNTRSQTTIAGTDNMTIIIVAILNGKTKQQWYEWITERAKTSEDYGASYMRSAYRR